MTGIDVRDLEALDKTLANLLEELPEARRELHESLGALMKETVDQSIASSGLNVESGRIQSWQQSHVGSGGGYAAVRAIGSREGGESGPNGPGAITNYLEGGHKIPLRRTSGNGYQPKDTKAYVDGYHFYKSARGNLEAKALQLADDFVDMLAQRLEGGGL